MITYRDITWCTSERCKNTSCTRRLTDDAEAMGIPVAYSDLRRVCSAFWDGDKRNIFGMKV